MEKQTLFYLFVGIFAVTAVITLLGITGVIKTIKDKYLNVLFTALILEVIAAVFLIFRGLDFTETPVNLSAIITKSGLSPPKDAKEQESFIIQKLTEIPQLKKLTVENEQLKNSLAAKDKEIEKIKGDVSRFDQNFYSNIIKLDDAISAYDGNINIGYQPRKKAAVYELLGNIFKKSGIIKDGDGTYDAENKINKLELRKKYYNFKRSYGQGVTNEEGAIIFDDSKLFLGGYDVSQMVKRYLSYRKVQPTYQAQFNANLN